MRETTGSNSLHPHCMAASISSSGTSFAADSTMTSFSGVPATTKSKSPASISGMVAFKINFPSLRPTRAAAIGPCHGIGEMATAHDAAISATIAASFSPSTASAVTTTCTSFLMVSSNSGRIERSIKRPERMASSLGRPSRLIKRDPFIFPAAYKRSSKSTMSGK